MRPGAAGDSSGGSLSLPNLGLEPCSVLNTPMHPGRPGAGGFRGFRYCRRPLFAQLLVFCGFCVYLYGMDRGIRQRVHPPTKLVFTSAVFFDRSLGLRVFFWHLRYPNLMINLQIRLVQNRFKMSFTLEFKYEVSSWCIFALILNAM